MKIVFALVLFLLSGCTDQHNDPASATAQNRQGHSRLVYTVNYPLMWMAEQLAGDTASIIFPAPAELDPAFWRPDTDTLLRYQQADIILLNGANYARWTANASLPRNRLVNTSAGYTEQLLAARSGPTHSHGPEGDHSHGELAFTTWLDLELAQQQAGAVAMALQVLMPEQATNITERLRTLQASLAEMDQQLEELGKTMAAMPLLYSHPVYQYLQARYRFNGQALHWEPDQVPEESQWRALTNSLESHPAKLMLWEAPPLPEVSARLEQMGISVIVFTTLGNRPHQGDFSTQMAANITALSAAARSLR